MTNSSTQITPEFEIRNFGPIPEAKLRLHPLTVFTGPEKTGKRDLVRLIYSIQNSLGSDMGPFGRHRVGRVISRDQILDLAETLPATAECQHSTERAEVVLRPSMGDLIRAEFGSATDAFESDICRCLAIDSGNAMDRSKGLDGTRIVWRSLASDGTTRFEHELQFAWEESKSEALIPDDFRICLGMKEALSLGKRMLKAMSAHRRGRKQKGGTDRFVEELGDRIFPYIAGPLQFPAYFLPKDRAELLPMHSLSLKGARELRSPEGPPPGLKKADIKHIWKFTRELPGVLADFIDEFQEIARAERPDSYANVDRGVWIERSLLGGSVIVSKADSDDKFANFTFRPDGGEDNQLLENSRPAVASLVAVTLYLRFLVGPGDLLIIEKPEAHLLPAQQVEFARQLVALVESGIRVIVTTESEWLLEELASIVVQTEPSKMDESGNTVSLRPCQVCVWKFEPGQRTEGTVIRETGLESFLP